MGDSTSPNLVRDPRFYFPDGNAVILVENTLFNVSTAMSAIPSDADIEFPSTDPSIYPESGPICV